MSCAIDELAQGAMTRKTYLIPITNLPVPNSSHSVIVELYQLL